MREPDEDKRKERKKKRHYSTEKKTGDSELPLASI
jgi:hypothetical protein